MALQKAVTFVLNAAEGVQAFPGKLVVLAVEKFDALTTQIVNKANEGNWDPPFAFHEAARDIQFRGYRRGVMTQAPIDMTPQPQTDKPAAAECPIGYRPAAAR
jgi:hypothetical protein